MTVSLGISNVRPLVRGRPGSGYCESRDGRLYIRRDREAPGGRRYDFGIVAPSGACDCVGVASTFREAVEDIEALAELMRLLDQSAPEARDA